MKLQNKLVILSALIATFGLMGCGNDSDSDSCDLTEASCQSVNKTLDADKCECVWNSDSSLCPTGKHVFSNTCEDDSLQNCGQHGYDCTTMIQGWKSGTCTNGQCMVSECIAEYHVFDNACEKDEVSTCGSHDTDCTTTINGWKSGTCTNGQCMVSECIAEHHIYDNDCEKDEVSTCGSHDIDCTTAINGWKDGTCTEGQCVVSECIAEYHVFDNACEADSLQTCGAHEVNCATMVNAWVNGACINGACVASECSDGYHPFQNTCEEESINAIITFGHYEQDNDTTNGKEPITWRVLDKNDSGQYLLISEKTLDIQPYNTTYISITWEKSTIRSWLNGYGASYNTVGTSFTSDNFIDAAFTAEEKNKIVSSNVPAHANPKYSTSPGSATTDKIFLLSITEAQNYFASDADRKADATKYAVKKGAFVKGSESGEYTTNGTCTDVHCSSIWWLRSPGNDTNSAAHVKDVGSINCIGDFIIGGYFAVRPALWVNLESVIF